MTSEKMQVSRSFSGRRWAVAECDGAAVHALAQNLEIPAIVARLLIVRGVDPGDATDHLNPTLKRYLPDPSILTDMDVAVAHVAAAIQAGKRIAVFGDYDVDGSCSGALLHTFLSAVDKPPRLYVPDRLTEGYGPNAAALLRLRDEGADLVLTVDCGAGAAHAIAAAKGLDVIVLDHHACEHEPPALAHVNPNRSSDTSGLGHLAAAGITFLFLVGLNRALRNAGWYSRRPEPDLLEYIDLVGMATVCDVVPLIGLNRAFVRQGLARMDDLRRPGLAALAQVAGVAPPFTPYHLGYVFGPRVNAGGRVGRCSLGVELLTCLDATGSSNCAAALDLHNRERQAIERLILEEATALAAPQDSWPFLLLAGDGWHPGVVGIVAGRLKDRFGKPCFVAGFEGGLGRGSARSVPGVDVGAIIRSAREAGVLDSGGGHAMAAGFSLRPDQADAFRAFLVTQFGALPTVAAPAGMTLDAIVSPAGATAALVNNIARVGPFGAGNPEPLFAVPDVEVTFADVVGRDHVRVRLRGGDGGRLDAIAFRMAQTDLGRGLLAARGQRVHVAGRLRAEEWNGAPRVQLHLEDAAPANA
ncbi:MAG: single-stranded-DNA-specific exonuclease RecJ [Alphaproteobacteria bacterium]|nr:single-stranded-DNA-specific exonuclease RecJ [Alphaproteobacteria bacterium]